MTQQEHTLMINMFAGQYHLIMTLFEILKSRGLATDDDLAPFSELVPSPISTQKLRELYLQRAQSLGVTFQ